MRADDPLERVADAIADGSAPDWDAVARGDDGRRALAEELRVVARIAALRAAAGGPFTERTWGGLTLVEKIGEGAAGEVFRAHDPRLDRDIALKLLKGCADDEAAGLDEGRLLARIRHHNVITVFGADRDRGRVGVMMELIDGRTLESVLAEQGPFGAREAALVGIELGRALSAVHRAGLLHRDIKTQNAMREAGGRIVLMDFGVGRCQRARARAADGHDTAATRLAGTPICLAPEVLAGAPASQRSDIYALGVLLFRLVTASYPVEGATIDDLASAHAAGARARLRDLRPDLPPSFITAVERAIAVDPAARFESAGALEAALLACFDEDRAPAEEPAHRRARRRRMVAAAITILLTAFASGSLSRPPTRPPQPPRSAPTFRSIAVLGIDGLSEDPMFAKGLTSAIAMELGRLEGVRIVSGASSISVGESGKAAAAIGRDLEVETVLHATAARTSAGLELSARLIETGSGRTVWHDRFTRDVRSIDILADALASAVATSVASGIVPRPPRAERHPAAYDAYLRGEAQWNTRTRDGLLAARDLFERAIALEPGWAKPYAGLANAYTLLSVYGILPKAQVSRKARAAAQKAVELDDGLAEAHTALAYVLVEEWDVAGGEAEYRRAMALNPSYALAFHWYALTIAHTRHDEAIAAIERARELDPLSRAIDTDVGMVYTRARRFDKAIAALKRAIGVHPDAMEARLALGEAYTMSRNPRAAARVYEEALAVDPSNPDVITSLGYSYAKLGRPEKVRDMLRRLHDVQRKRYVRPFGFAALHAALGETHAALDWIEKGVEMRDDWASGLASEAEWLQSLRGHPRFEALAKRVKDAIIK